MYFIKSIFLLIVCVSFASAQPQKLQCGTPHLEDIKQEMLRNREIFKNVIHSRNAVSYIPVKIHNVALDEGTGATSFVNILRMMCTVNKAYADQNIQFFIKDMYTLNSTTIATTPQQSNANLQMQLFKDSKAMNIFIVHKINDDGTVGYYIGPPGSNLDYVVIDKNFLNHNLVVPHEIGHYLSLPHTFHGWEGAAWDQEKHGNPVIKTFAPDGITLIELADSSNCGARNVGDGFCDTPADYNFGLGATTCTFTKDVKDFNGKQLKPQTNNFMNYFFNCGEYIFTNQQRTAILNSYNSNGRREIRGSVPANTTVINSPVKLLTPIGGIGTLTADSVLLDWEDLPGATSYLVQHDRLPSFEFRVQTFITKESKIMVKNLVKDGTYHWRVIPYNEYSTCYAEPAKSTFKAGGGTSTPDIPEVKSFLVTPNPLSHTRQLQISIESKLSFTASISIIGINGRSYYFQSKEKLPSGTFSKSLDLSNLAAGVYFVSLTSEKGISTRKIMVY